MQQLVSSDQRLEKLERAERVKSLLVEKFRDCPGELGIGLTRGDSGPAVVIHVHTEVFPEDLRHLSHKIEEVDVVIRHVGPITVY